MQSLFVDMVCCQESTVLIRAVLFGPLWAVVLEGVTPIQACRVPKLFRFLDSFII